MVIKMGELVLSYDMVVCYVEIMCFDLNVLVVVVVDLFKGLLSFGKVC